ncbi:hypothetical protein JTB14_002937 [Gonioctena quinquepunctata]|nr:hypothetical protein JTB14_002937 [Gonioctena quinquepunctata]
MWSPKTIDQEIVALYDSGSTVTIVGEEGVLSLERHGIEVSRNNCQITHITTADDTENTVKGLVDLPICVETLSTSGERKLDDVISSFEIVNGDLRLGRTDKVTMHIDTGDALSVRQRQYPMSPFILKIMNKELDGMIELGVVEESQSDWCSSVLLENEANGEKRLCFDATLLAPINALSLGRKKNESIKWTEEAENSLMKIKEALDSARISSSADFAKPFTSTPLNDLEEAGSNKFVVRTLHFLIGRYLSPRTRFTRIQDCIEDEDESQIVDREVVEERYVAVHSKLRTLIQKTVNMVSATNEVVAQGKYYGEIQSTADLEVVPRDRDPYVSDINSLKDIFDEVHSSLHKSYKKNASHYNLRRRDVSFEVGDKVYRRNKSLSKAADKYCAEPCTIVQKMSRLVYKSRNADDLPGGEWHVNDLNPYLGSNSDISSGSKPGDTKEEPKEKVIKNTEKFQEYSEVTATLPYTQQEYNLLLDDIKREARRKARIAGEEMKEQHKEKKDRGIPYDVVAQASQEAVFKHWMKQLPEENKKK